MFQEWNNPNSSNTMCVTHLLTQYAVHLTAYWLWSCDLTMCQNCSGMLVFCMRPHPGGPPVLDVLCHHWFNSDDCVKCEKWVSCLYHSEAYSYWQTTAWTHNKWSNTIYLYSVTHWSHFKFKIIFYIWYHHDYFLL